MYSTVEIIKTDPHKQEMFIDCTMILFEPKNIVIFQRNNQ